MAKRPTLFLGATTLVAAGLCAASTLAADTNFTVGVWGTYAYLPDNDVSRDTWGAIEGEALILYADGRSIDSNWLYSAEFRIGPGSFSDPENNSTGGQYTFKEAWVGWELDDDHVVKVGKSAVPFAWKTYNFWPGDMLQAGFGDQMDVGVKLSGSQGRWHYDAAMFLADDWGTTSTDTVDDNGHWGSSTTFRKVQTWVGDLSYEVIDNHFAGVSLQRGGLQDLTGLGDNRVDGDHWAAAAHYQAQFDRFYAKASYITMERELPPLYREQAELADTIANQRYSLELGYDVGPWSYYLDVTHATPDTAGSQAGSVTAISPGLRYNYGPGWVYVEYLSQNGGVNRDGQVVEGDFDALYVTLDFYL